MEFKAVLCILFEVVLHPDYLDVPLHPVVKGRFEGLKLLTTTMHERIIINLLPLKQLGMVPIGDLLQESSQFGWLSVDVDAAQRELREVFELGLRQRRSL